MGLESNSTPCIGRGITEWCIDRSFKRCSERKGQAKRYQKNIQNTERNVVKYKSRKDKYA